MDFKDENLKELFGELVEHLTKSNYLEAQNIELGKTFIFHAIPIFVQNNPSDWTKAYNDIHNTVDEYFEQYRNEMIDFFDTIDKVD